MGRTAHCPPWRRALRSLPLGDANRDVLHGSRGAIGRARRTDPPSGGLFHVQGRISGSVVRRFVQSDRPVRTPSVVSTIRAAGRAAAASPILSARLRRVGARTAGATGTRELESVSRVAGELARSADVEAAARRL